VIPSGTPGEDLLAPVLRRGEPVAPSPPLAAVRARVREQLAGFHSGVKRLLHPHQFPVGLEHALHELRIRLVLEARGVAARVP
jgi:nicotinate phosphoribosyltransferase